MGAGRATVETWKPVIGYEFRYEVSSLGRVRRVCTTKGTNSGRILTGGLSSYGHRKVDLWRGHKRTGALVCDLLAAAFRGPRPVGSRIRFRDGDQANITAENITYTKARRRK